MKTKMSDDEDYMSSTFLNATEDIRPGLIFSKCMKRKHEIEKHRIASNKLHKTKSHKQLEEEHRNVGMDSALNSDNKGFAMLQKMGYKPGMKLGPIKENSVDSGLAEPIKVKVKLDRGGLGREEEIKKQIQEREERKNKIKIFKEKETQRLTEEYCERMRSKLFYKHLMCDLRKSQKVCEQLDIEHGVIEPMRSWFWYSQVQRSDSDEDSTEEGEEELDPEEQLSFVLDYLRSKYLYCLWCGVKYDTIEDMTLNCPGTEKNDHEA